MGKYGIGKSFTGINGEIATVIEKVKGGYYGRLIKFHDTNHIRKTNTKSLANKTFADNSLFLYSLGKEFVNSAGQKATVVGKPIKKRSHRYILFSDTKNIIEAEATNLHKGQFKDYKVPSVYGVGYSYRGAKSTEKVYKAWSGMIERCYVEDRSFWKWYGAKGVKVSDRWLHLKNFEEDIKELEGYDLFIKDNKRIYSLDKDTIGDGLLYSKENCCFITQEEQLQTQDRVVPIESTSKHGEVEIHKSINQAAIKLGAHPANINKVLNGERKHTLGYTFKRLQKLI